jgi:AcrR family transcriptional regulator
VGEQQLRGRKPKASTKTPMANDISHSATRISRGVPRILPLTPALIIDAAERIVDHYGWNQLTMAALAEELGVRSPSLYKHVTDLEQVRRLLGLRGIETLADVMCRAVMGKIGRDAIFSIAVAFREMVRNHPGRYEAQIHLAGKRDRDYWAAGARAIEAVSAALASFGFEDDNASASAIAMWSSMHGFVSLEISFALESAVDFDSAFYRIVDAFASSFERGVIATRESFR